MLSPEVLRFLPDAALGLFTIAFLALTQKQRLAVIERDEHKCQGKDVIPHSCTENKYPLEVHHILNQAYCNLMNVNPDYALNLITLCRSAHDQIHPWRIWARSNYHKLKSQGKNTFSMAQDEVKEKLGNKEVPWEDKWDRQLQTRAVRNTQRKGFLLPERRYRKNNCAE